MQATAIAEPCRVVLRDVRAQRSCGSRLAALSAVVVAPRTVSRGASTIADDALAFVRACADGDAAARRLFLDRFASDVYAFPTKVYGLPPDQAADFFLYVFEGDRVFARLRSFEGRNAIQLRTFLAYYVLRGLFLDWQRGRRELETVPLDAAAAPGEGQAPADRLAAPEPEAGAPPAGDARVVALWSGLSPEERLDLKLLSLLEHDLDAADLRLLARVARRSLAETRRLVAEVQAELCARDERLAALRAALDRAWGWIVLRRRELRDADEALRALGDAATPAAERLRERRRRLGTALERRLRQRDRILAELRAFKTTTPYKDIARLRGSSVGTVCSRIFRLRERLEARWRAAEDLR